MTSYQVLCSVMRPPDPTSLCQVRDLQEKTPQFLDLVFQDLKLTPASHSHGHSIAGRSHSIDGRSHSASDSSLSEAHDREAGSIGRDTNAQTIGMGDNLLLCAVVSKTSASFSGADNYKSRVKLPFFWCNWCPYDTESKASLLQHIVSQHCFICRFCPFVALSRYDIVSHGLSQHPQFSQFRDQRLKSCHLKRDLFQLHFDPKSDCQESRKRRLDSECETGNDPGPSSVKNCREERSEGIAHGAVERLEEEEESSSESVDEVPVNFPQASANNSQSQPSTSANTSQSQPSTSHQDSKRNGSTHVMENVVSSSGMEADTGTDQLWMSKPGPRTDPPPSHTLSATKDHLSTNIKQEPSSEEAVFAHALGVNNVADNADAGLTAEHDMLSIHPDVKQEPDEEQTSVPQAADGQSSVLSRSTCSPPLSNIRVENLQRQFEESFGVHPVALTSVTSEHQQHEPMPLNLITHSNRPRELVENFLIDSSQYQAECEESLEDQSSASMLRHLLTRPLQDGLRLPSPDKVPVDQQDTRSNETEGEAKQRQDMKADTEAVSGHMESNFLLTSDHHRNTNMPEVFEEAGKCRSPSTAHVTSHHEILSAGRLSPMIKQEPEESNDDYTMALNLMTSIPTSRSTGSERDSFTSGNTKQHHQNNQPGTSSSHQQQKKTQQADLTCPESDATHTSRPTCSMSQADKLKSFSNMSLLDLLTMDTKIGVSHTGDGHDSKEEVGQLANDVVWECGFCDFEHEDKAVVLGHRHHHHAHYMDTDTKDTDPDRTNRHHHHAQYMDTDTKHTEPDRTNVKEIHGTRATDIVENIEERLEQDAHKGGVSVNWMDQPSTSTGHTTKSRLQYTQLYQSERHQTSNKRTRRVQNYRRDDSYDYLSDSSVDFDNDSENTEDETYEPPGHGDFESMLVSSEEEEEYNEKLQSKKFSFRDKRRKKRYTDWKRSPGKAPFPKRDSSGVRKDDLFSCLSCRRHQPCSLQAIKHHIQHTPTSDHLLMVRPIRCPESLHFICPSDRCSKRGITLFSDCRSYLVHVLHCQGHIFDAGKVSVETAISSLMSKMTSTADHLDCPITTCHSISSHNQQLKNHLSAHVDHFQASQMLLFRSVCTVMAKAYGQVEGFDRYICYRCSSILMDLPAASQHMTTEHKGQVKGVLLVSQRSEIKAQGIVVAIQCLQCSSHMSSFNLWFTHQCTSISQLLKTAGCLDPVSSVPSFYEWVWRLENSGLTLPDPNTPTTKIHSVSQVQLPLIRSILLGQFYDQSQDKDSTAASSQLGLLLKNKKDSTEDVTVMTQCDHCQQLIPEESGSHSCHANHANKARLQSQDHKVTETFSSSSLSQQPFPTMDTNVSHSKLLAALATHHTNKPPDSQSTKPLPLSSAMSSPSLSSTSHPSLLTLLTQKKLNDPPPKQTASSQFSQASNSNPSQFGQLRKQLAYPHTSSLLESRPSFRETNMLHSIITSALKQHQQKETQDTSQTSSNIHRAIDTWTPPVVQKETLTPSAVQNETAFQMSAVSSDPAKEGQTGGKQKNNNGAESATNVGEIVKREVESHFTPTSLHPPLMNFLRQQGDQVRQVLENVLDDQDQSPQP